MPHTYFTIPWEEYKRCINSKKQQYAKAPKTDSSQNIHKMFIPKTLNRKGLNVFN